MFPASRFVVFGSQLFAMLAGGCRYRLMGVLGRGVGRGDVGWGARFAIAAMFIWSVVAQGATDTNSADLGWWRESMVTREERVAWWREGRFGMFVHWGVYSHLGGTWQGKPVKGYAEHIQRMLKIPIPTYREQVAGNFNPTSLDADEWIRTAKEAGMSYFIITAKHHDGFAMWDSRASEYNIVKATPFHRDPMKELKAACQKYGLKFGFYYSHAFDWGDANAPGNDWDYRNPGGDLGLHGGRTWWETSPQFLPQVREYVDRKSIPQLLELISNYDPDILWFDTPHKLPPEENLRILKAVRQAKPGIVINGRLVRGMGDYDSTADRPAEFVTHEGDWEGIPTTNESYGWNRNDLSHKPASHFIQLLAKAAARGGNLLMNVGPMGDGRLDPKDVEILKGIGAWWKTNGESIRGTSRTPLAVQTWGESTRKGNTLYLHVFQWPASRNLIVGGLRSEIKGAYLLSDPARSPLKTRRLSALDLAVEVPAQAPDKVDAVVVVECAVTPLAERVRLLQGSYPSDTLRVFDGERHGKLRFGAGKKTDAYVQEWTNKADFISWPVRLNDATTFELSVVYDAEAGSAGNRFAVQAGSQRLVGAVQAGREQTAMLGRMALPAGGFEVRVAPEYLKGGELMRLRSLVLKPIETKKERL